MLVYAIVFINLACALYTIGVWGEKIQGRLQWWHVGIFWAGVVCDTIGTGAMGKIAGSIFRFNFHGITGLTAIVLMLFHALWATWVMIKKDEAMKVRFHRFSIPVWIIWLVPMLSGIIFGATK